MARPRRLPWDIYEEHLEEAAFLWALWESALSAAHSTLAEVIQGPEERLRAHLDGLVLGGVPVATRLLVPALRGDDPGKAFASALALLHAEDADHSALVLEAACTPDLPGAAGLSRALGLAERGDLAGKTEAPQRQAPAVQAAMLSWLASDPQALGAWVSEALASSEPSVILAGLRSVRRLGATSSLGDVERAVDHVNPEVRAEALATGLLLGSPRARAVCEDGLGEPEPAARWAAAWTALRSPRAVKPLADGVADPGRRRTSLWALGFAGTAEAGDVLVEWLTDDEVAPLAAEALSAITGLSIAGRLARAGSPRADEDEVGPDDPPPEVSPEDHLAMPDARALSQTWAELRARMPAGIPFVYGQPRSQKSLVHALVHGPMWRRPVYALELARQERRGVPFDERGWCHRQLRELAERAGGGRPG